MKRLRVLISTHEFSPYQGSECALGWNIATRIAQYHDVTVLCAEGPANDLTRYREAFSKYSEQHGAISGLTVIFVKQPPATLRYASINRKLMTLTKGFGWTPLFYMGLDAWHREVFSVAMNLGFQNFDIAHQLTPISFIRPGYLWKTNLPFFWGPIGGMYKVPLVFALTGGVKSLLFEMVRSINIELRTLTCSFRRIVKKSKKIWAITPEELRIINHIDPNKSVQMTESAAPSEIVGFVRQYDGNRPLIITWSGTHEPRKALPLLLNALSLLSDNDKKQVLLNVLGEGSETQRWKAIASNLLLDNIKWHGRLPYFDALHVMKNSDIFVHTSFREATSHVILEALAWGIPIVCHDACGMAIAVDDTCGIKVPLIDPQYSINGFCEGIKKLLYNPALITTLSEGALRRSTELSWDAKVKTIAEAYLQ